MFGSKSTPDSKFQIILLSYGWPSSWALISFSFSHFTPNRGSLLLLRFSCLFVLSFFAEDMISPVYWWECVGLPFGWKGNGRKWVHLFLAKRDVWAGGNSSGEIWCASGVFLCTTCSLCSACCCGSQVCVTPLSQTPMYTDPAFCA